MIKIKIKKNLFEIEQGDLISLKIPDAGDQFSNLFGGKQRILIPLEAAKSEDDFIGFSDNNTIIAAIFAIRQLLKSISTEEYSYDIDFTTGSLKQIYSYIIPKGLQAGQKTTKVKNTPLQRFIDLLDKAYEEKITKKEAGNDATDEFKKNFLILFPKTNDIGKQFSEKPSTIFKILKQQTNLAIEQKRKSSDGEDDWHKTPEISHTKYAYAEAKSGLEMILKNAPKHFLIISRKPIDILRMSDHPGMRSCHRPPSPSGTTRDERASGEYFNCAVHESRGNGAVAYFVSNSNLNQISDLENAEIFKDPDRGIEGVIPVTRIRLRRYMFLPTKQEFLLPETTIYGTTKDVDLFKKTLNNWALNSQKDVISSIISRQEISLSDFILIGGSYADNSTLNLLKNFIPQIIQRKLSKDDLNNPHINKSFSEISSDPKQILISLEKLKQQDAPYVKFFEEKRSVSQYGNEYEFNLGLNLDFSFFYGHSPQETKKYNNMNTNEAEKILKEEIGNIKFNKIKIKNIRPIRAWVDVMGKRNVVAIMGVYIQFSIQNFNNKNKLLEEYLEVIEDVKKINSKLKEIYEKFTKTSYITKTSESINLMKRMLELSGILKS